MNRFKRCVAFAMLMVLMMMNSGCAVIGAALSAGIGYGIYMATKK